MFGGLGCLWRMRSGRECLSETQFGLWHGLGSLDLDRAIMDISPAPRMNMCIRLAKQPRCDFPPSLKANGRIYFQAIHHAVSQPGFVMFLAIGFKNGSARFRDLPCTRSHDLKFIKKLTVERVKQCLSQGQKLLKAKLLLCGKARG